MCTYIHTHTYINAHTHTHTHTHIHADVRNTGVDALARALETNSHLVHLNLEATCITQGGFKILGSSLATNSTLQRLNIGGCRVNVGDIESLAQGLLRNSSLRTLQLSSFMSPDACMAPIAHVIMRTVTLRHLDLSLNGICTNDVHELAHALRLNTSLEFLDVSGHSLSNAGQWELCNALCMNHSLRVLKLGFLVDSSISPDGRHPALRNLVERNVTLLRIDAFLPNHEYDGVLEALACNSTLQSLRLRGRSCTTCTNTLVRALHSNLVIGELDLKYACDTPSLHAVANALQQCPRYHKLNLKKLPLSVVEDAFDLPATRRYGNKDIRTDYDIMSYIHALNMDKFVGFAMGQHSRLGAASLVHMLTPDILCIIMLCYFGLPRQYFDQPRPTLEDVHEVLQHVDWLL
jgi:hypothetical protein